MTPHPSMLLFDDVWRFTLCRCAPWLLLPLLKEARRHYKLNVWSFQMLALENYQRYISPASVLVEPHPKGQR